MSSRRSSTKPRNSPRTCSSRSTCPATGRAARAIADGTVTTPKGFKEAYAAYGDGGWQGLAIPEAYGGQGLPHVVSTAVAEYMSSANMAFAMYPGLTSGRDGGAARLRQRGTEAALRSEHGGRQMDRHDEPDGAALRHRPRASQDQGRAPARRLLRHHRAENLHLGRRARPRGEHHPSRHRAYRRRAGRREGHLALRRAAQFHQRRRLGRRAQRGVLRRDRAQDGHPRQRHLRAELRRRERLARRRGEQGPASHVRDDERGATRRRRTGPLAVGSRDAERRRLCARPPPGPRHLRRRRRRTSRPIRSSCIRTSAAA